MTSGLLRRCSESTSPLPDLAFKPSLAKIYQGCRLCGGSAAGEQRKALLTIIADVAGNRAAIESLTKQLVSKITASCEELEVWKK